MSTRRELITVYGRVFDRNLCEAARGFRVKIFGGENSDSYPLASDKVGRRGWFSARISGGDFQGEFLTVRVCEDDHCGEGVVVRVDPAEVSPVVTADLLWITKNGVDCRPSKKDVTLDEQVRELAKACKAVRDLSHEDALRLLVEEFIFWAGYRAVPRPPKTGRRHDKLLEKLVEALGPDKDCKKLLDHFQEWVLPRGS